MHSNTQMLSREQEHGAGGTLVGQMKDKVRFLFRSQKGKSHDDRTSNEIWYE